MARASREYPFLRGNEVFLFGNFAEEVKPSRKIDENANVPQIKDASKRTNDKELADHKISKDMWKLRNDLIEKATSKEQLIGYMKDWGYYESFVRELQNVIKEAQEKSKSSAPIPSSTATRARQAMNVAAVNDQNKTNATAANEGETEFFKKNTG